MLTQLNAWLQLEQYVNPVRRQIARNVSYMGLLGFLLVFAISFNTIFISPITNLPTNLLILGVFIISSYLAVYLTRIGRYEQGVYAIAFAIVLGPILAFGYDNEGIRNLNLYWLGIVVLGLLGSRRVVFVSGGVMIATWFVSALTPEAGSLRIDGVFLSIAIQIVAVITAYVIAEDLRNVFEESIRTESLRRLGLVEINNQIISGVFSRRNIDEVLNNVVNDIRERFEGVYHAQVFLIDDDGRDAVLRSSTGAVGRKLIERGHKLGVGSQSVIGQVTRRAEFVLAGDTSNDPVHRRNELLPETRTELALPLRVEAGGVIGALDLQSRIPNAFAPQDIEIFQLLADQIALAIDNATLLHEARTQAEENARLLRREQVNRQEIERLNRELTEQAWMEHLGDNVVRKRIDLGTGQISELAELSARAAEVSRVGELEVVTKGQQQVIALPIKTNNVVIGVLEFEIPMAHQADPNAIQALPAVAERVGLFAENTRLFQQTKSALTEIERLYEMAQVINAAADADIEDIYQIVLDRLMNESSLERAAVLLSDPIPSFHTSNLVVDYWWERYPSEDGDWSEGWRKGQKLDYLRRGFAASFENHPADPIVIAEPLNPHNHEKQVIADIMSAMQAQSLILLPLVSGERWFGLLICAAKVVNAFPASFVNFAQAAAGQVATSIETRRLLDEVQNEARRALALAEAGQLVTALAGGEFRDGVTRLFRAVSGPGEFDRWWFGLIDPDGTTLRAVSVASSATSDLTFPEVLDVNTDDNALTEVIHAPQPLLVDSFEEAHPILGEIPEDIQKLYGQHLVVPVVSRDESILGVLMIGRSEDATNLDERDLQLATTLANQLSIAIENQELFRAAESRRQTLNNTLETMPAGVVIFTPDGEVALANDDAIRLLGSGIQTGMFAENTYAVFDVNTDKPHEPEQFPIALAFQQKQATNSYNFYIVPPDGRRRDVLVSTALVYDESGELLSIVAIFQEITELRELETALQASLSETTALYEASRSIAAAATKKELINALTEQLRPVGADRIYMLFHEGQDDADLQPSLVSVVPPDPSLNLPTDDLKSSGLPLEVLTPEELLSIDNIEKAGNKLSDKARTMLLNANIHSVMSHPLKARGNRIIGWIVVLYEEPYKFTADERRFLSTLADQAAISLDVNRLFESTQNALQSVANLYRGSKRVTEASTITDAINALQEEVMNLSPDRIDLILQQNPDNNDVVYAAIAWAEDRSLADIPAVPVDPVTLRSQTDFELMVSEAYFIEDISVNNANALQEGLLALDTPYQAIISLPLRIGGRVLGRLSLGFLEPRRFASDDRQFIEMLADSMAYVSENELLFQQTQDSLEETGVLYQASKAIAAAQTRDDIVQALIDYAASAVVDKVMLIGLNSDDWYSKNAQITVITTWGRGDFLDLRGLSFTPVQLPIWSQLSADEVVWSDDVATDPQLDEFTRLGFSTLDVASYVIVPLRTPLGPLGAIMLGASQPRVHLEREIRIYESLADQAAVQLQNKELIEQADIRTRQLQVSAEVTRSATEILDMDVLFPRIVQLIKEAFNYDHAQIFMLDEPQENAVLQAATGEAGEQMLAVRHSLPVGSASVVGQATATGRYFLVNDTSELGANHRPNPFLPETRSELAIPLLVKNNVLGAIDLQSNRAGAFTEDDINTLLTLADQLAIAIDNARLFEVANQRADDMSFLFDVTSTAAAAAAGLNETLETLGTVLIRQLRSSSVELFLYESTTEKLQAQLSITLEERDGNDEYIFKDISDEIDLGHGLIGWVGRHLRPIIINDFEQEEDYFPARADSRSGIFVPLASGADLLGVLGIESTTPYQFDNEDLRLLLTLSSTLAPIIQNAQLVSELQATNERLREIDQLKTNFLAAMSHELRTPLNSIIGFSRVILKGIDGPITDMQEQDIQTIHDSGKHLLNLVNDILDQAKIEAGKMELVKEYFDLGTVVKSLMSSAQGLTKYKSVQLFTEIEEGLPEAFGDEFRTRQIILNIIGNAAKFTNEGSITVSVYSFDKADTGSKMLVVSVADTGIGIAPENITKIFESFQQVDNTTTRSAEGTGLGLPLARSLAELQGGGIEVDSVVGQGSTFRVYIPTEPDVVEDEDATLSEDSKLATVQLDKSKLMTGIPPQKRPTSELKRRVILAVDDEVGMINLYRRYLSKEGWQIIGETDPNRAEEMVAAHAPQLILLDINMPNRDGWDVLENLRRRAESSDIPVIICSIETDAERSSQLGASKHITKPFDERDLVEAVREVQINGST